MHNLADLHWLPIRARINSKIAFMTFKTLTTRRPSYLFDLLCFRTTPRLLRSSDHRLLHDVGAKTVFGSRAFRHAAPSVWNSLPSHLTDDFNSVFLSTFKRGLKLTFIISLSYPSRVTVFRACDSFFTARQHSLLC